jgi:hypothetical protein
VLLNPADFITPRFDNLIWGRLFQLLNGVSKPAFVVTACFDCFVVGDVVVVVDVVACVAAVHLLLLAKVFVENPGTNHSCMHCAQPEDKQRQQTTTTTTTLTTTTTTKAMH